MPPRHGDVTHFARGDYTPEAQLSVEVRCLDHDRQWHYLKEMPLMKYALPHYRPGARPAEYYTNEGYSPYFHSGPLTTALRLETHDFSSTLSGLDALSADAILHTRKR